VLSAELELHDLDARQWKNWWHLLTPPGVLAPPRWALVILDRGAVHKVVISGEGARPDAALAGPPARAIAGWAKQLGVAAVIAVERTLLAELSAEIDGALRLDQDLVAQGLIVLAALKRHAGRGLWTEPAVLDVVPAPSFEPVQRTFDLLIPDRAALVGYVFDDDRRAIHASIIAVKAHGDIVRAATHRAIADLVPEAGLARGWATGHRRVVEAVEQRFAAPAIAVFTERATLLRVVTGPTDQLARELAAKRVIIDPAPAWLLGLLGGAAVAAVAGRAASALAGMLPQATRDRASALASRARGALKDTGADPFALLGFDPIELWARLRQYYRPPAGAP
jgi:hypothetical protein